MNARSPRWRPLWKRSFPAWFLTACLVLCALALPVRTRAQQPNKLANTGLQDQASASPKTSAGSTAPSTEAPQLSVPTGPTPANSIAKQSPAGSGNANPAAAPRNSADEDEESDDEDSPWADLNVRLTPKGTGSIYFSEYGAASESADWSAIFHEAFGCALRRISGGNSYVRFQGDGCVIAARGAGLRYQGQIRLTPLVGSLRAANLNIFSVSISQASGVSMKCSPSPKQTMRGGTACRYFLLVSPAATTPGASPAFTKSGMWETASSLPRIDISYGLDLAEIDRAGLALGIVLLIPVLVTLWMRRAALRAAERIVAGLRSESAAGQPGSLHDDRAGIWFGYWRSMNWVLNGALVLWWAVSDAVQLTTLLAMVLGAAGPGQSAWAFHLADSVGFWIPPLLVAVLCQTLSHPVQVHVRGLAWTRKEVLKQSVWSLAASWLPLLLFLNGLEELALGSSKLGVAWLAAAFFGRIYAARKSAAAQGLTPRALTAGELRDRIFAMAKTLHVKLTQVYVVATGKARLANAFARTGNSILLTDALLESLNRREVDAVVAHELSHLKHGHPQKLGMAWLGGLVAAIFMMSLVPSTGVLDRLVRYSLVFLVPVAFVYFFSRRFEYTADRAAVKLTGDPEAQITSLVKLNRLNLLPLQWGRVQGKFLTHPSTLQRARSIARAGGISEARVPEIVQRAVQDRRGEPAAVSPAIVAMSSESSRPSAISTSLEGADRGLSSIRPEVAKPLAWTSPGGHERLAPPQPVKAQAWDTGSPADSSLHETSISAGVATSEPPAPETPASPGQATSGTSQAPAVDSYALPAGTTGEEKVFSSTYKHRNAFRNAWLFISTLILPPALVAFALRHIHLPLGTPRYALLGGWILTLGLAITVANNLRSWEATSLRRRLREKAEKAGIDPAGWGGRFVGFSPHAAPRTYENKTVWDIGFLFVYPDRICYWGEETGFALRRNQITAIQLAGGPPGWVSSKSIYISWQDGQRRGTFNLRAGDVSSTREMARQTRLLAGRLQSWCEHAPFHRDLPPSLARLGAPQLGEVTGASPRAGAKPRVVIRTTILLGFVGWAVSLMFGLPVFGLLFPLTYLSVLLGSPSLWPVLRHSLMSTLPAAMGWYVILTAWTVYWVLLIPVWLHRDPVLRDAPDPNC
jgi:Zn-dependent protease with chaperone function